MANTSYYAKKKEDSDKKIQAALDARNKRTASASQTFVEEKKEVHSNKLETALNARNIRIQNSLPDLLADIQNRFNTEISSYSSTKPAYGAYEDTYKSQRERRLNISDLRKKVNAYRSYMQDGEADSILSALDQMDKGYDAYLGMSQYDSEESYNTAVKQWQDYYDKWGHYADAEDFGQYSSAGKEIPYTDIGSETRHRAKSRRQRSYTSIDNYRAAAIALAEHNGNNVAFKPQYEDKIAVFRNMKSDEFQLLSYFIAKDKAEGSNLAEQYVDAMADTLTSRRGQEIATNLDNIDIPVIEDVAKLATGWAGGFINAYEGIVQYATGEKLPTDVSQYANKYISESLDGIGYYAHQAATTIGNMTPSILVSSALGPAAGAATMGVSVAGNAYAQALDWGYDKTQARVYGTIIGALEGGLQYAIGGISKLSGLKLDGKIVSKIAAIDKAALRISAKLGWENLKEIGEEELQNYLEPLVRSIVLGEEYDAPTAAELFETAIVTLFSTSALEGPGTIYGDISDSKHYKNEYGEFQADLVDQALEGGDFANQLAQKYKGILDSGKDLSGHQLGRLVEANEQQYLAEDTASIQSAAESRLAELGETGDVTAIAEVLTKQASGEKLSRAERQIISNSKYGQRVANEMNRKNIRSGGYASAWAENIGTERINVEEYSRLVEAAQLPQETAEATEGKLFTKAQKFAQPAQTSLVDTPAANTSPYEVSAEGKTIDKDGNVIDIVGVDSVKDGRMILKTNTGTIDSSDVQYANETDALVYSAVSKLGASPSSSWNMINGFKESDGVSARTYAAEIPLAYRYGKLNYKKGLLNLNIAPKQSAIAFEMGREDAAAAVKPATNASTESTLSEKNADKKVIFEGFTYNEKSANDVQKASMAAIDMINKASSLEIHVYKSVKKNGKLYAVVNGKERLAPNGYFTDGNKIYIDINAGNKGEGLMLYTLSHEIGHYIARYNANDFKAISDFLFEHYGKDVPIDVLIEEQKAKLKKNYEADGKTVPSESVLEKAAQEELVCDMLSQMMADKHAYDKLMDLKQKDLNAFQKLGQAIKKALDKLAKVLGIYDTQNPDFMYAASKENIGEEAFRQLQDLYVRAFVQADANYQAEAAQKNTTKNGDVSMSVREIVGKSGTNYGVGVYLDSNKLTNIPEAQRKSVVIGEFRKLGGKKIVAYDKNGVATEISIADSSRRYKNSKGKSIPVNNHITSFLKDSVKQEALILADEVIATSRFEGTEDALHAHDWLDNDGKNQWDVWKVFLQEKNNSVWEATLKVANTTDGEKILYELYPIELVEAAWEPGTSTTNDMVAQPFSTVKTDPAKSLDIEVDEKTESVAPAILKSERTWTESDYVQERELAAKEIAKAIGVSVKKAKAYIDSVNSIAKMIAEDRVRLDYFSSPGRSSFVGNVEYGGSFDFSTLCKKRRLLTGTFTAIQKALPNTALTADEILDIRNRMKDAGLEVSCGLCYVEGSRANMGQFAKEFLRLYKQYYPDAWQPNMADVNTPDGIEWVRINHPECYEQYEYFWNHYGTLKDGDKNLFASQQKPKLYQLHTEYKGEILEKFNDDDNVEEKNLNGGIRLQSFSDFEIVHLIDTMQIIMDMSRVGLAGQAYTKVPDFAWALGDTGLKINLSLIAKGVDENGRLIFDDVEGMPIDKAVELRNRYSKNVGTILVAFNDEQLMAAMADERVDYIIPFHRSQWKKSQYGAMGLPTKTKDYTYMQNEKFIKPQYHEYRGRMVKDKATNYMPNEYWDFSKSGKENAEAYLEMCARNNKRPKFYKLLQNNGDGSYSLKADGSTDGYWKLLIDFKMYDNDGVGSPQMPVKPDFNMDEATRMLDEYSGGHSNFPVAQDVVDDFVQEYTDSHKGVQYSDRDSDGNQLSTEQQEFFKDSFVRDSDGNLRVVYHGTYEDFTVFDISKTSITNAFGEGHYFTSQQSDAQQNYASGEGADVHTKIESLAWMYFEEMGYSEADYESNDYIAEWNEAYDKAEAFYKSGKVMQVYLNITNPLYAGRHGELYNSSNEEVTARSAEYLKKLGYDGIIDYHVSDRFGRFQDLDEDTAHYIVFDSNQIKLTSNNKPTSNPDIRYSDRDNVPTFYSQMARVVDGLKQEKHGAASVVSTLRNKGVKAEEIKWSGIEEWLAGKKSVTKAELQEFIAGSMLQIEEEILDNKDRPYTEDQQKRLDEYEAKRDEVANRVAAEWKKITGEEFTIRNAAGLESLVTQAILEANSKQKKATFEGRLLAKLKSDLKEVIENNDDFGFDSWMDAMRSIHRHRRDFITHYEMSTNEKAIIVKYCNALNAYNELPNMISDADTDRLRAIAREAAPWNRKIMEVKHEYNEESAKNRPNWKEYSLKGGKNYREMLFRIPGSTYSNEAMFTHWKERKGVLAHARVQDMDTFIGKMLFVEEIQSDWHNEGHKKEYRDVPDAPFKETYHEYVLKRLLREAAEQDYDSIGWTTADTQMERWNPKRKTNEQMGIKAKNPNAVAFEDGYRIEYDQDIPKFLSKLGKKWGTSVGKTVLDNGTEVWSMAVTDEMKDSVMTEGQALYSDRDGVDNSTLIGKNNTINTRGDKDVNSMKSNGNGATFNGKPFWSGSVSLLDGVIEEVHSYQEAEAADFHHSMYFSSAQVEKMANGENGFFFVEDGKVHGEWRESVPKNIISKIEQQIVKYSDFDDWLLNGDFLFQDRTEDSVSNRSLLANAFEGVAQNEIEKNKIQEYKEKISLINSEEQKLSELNEQIKELSFSKGPRDTKAIRDLQFEARQTANRINTYDKQLLRLEASKPLQDVLQREKKMAYKRAEQKGKEALEAYREKTMKTQRELLEKWQDSRKKGIEGRHKTAMRHKIKDIVNELNQYLLRGTKDRHVPIELQKAVAEALDAVNMDTVGAEERIAKLKDELLKAKTPEQIQEISRKIDHIQAMGDKMNGRLQKLKDAYDQFVNSDDPLIANSHDEVISNKLQSVIDSIGNTPLRDMTLSQLEDVYDMYRMVLTTIRNANKAFKAKKNESISTIANQVMVEVEKAGGKQKQSLAMLNGIKSFGWNNLKPVYAFEHIGSDHFTEVFKNVRAGEDVWAVDVTEARDFYLDKSKKYKYDSWDLKKRHKFTSTSGMDFELDLEQIMSLYAYSKRDQAADHLNKGGIVFDESTKIIKKTKVGISLEFNPTEATAYNISPETLADIVSKLTDEQKGFVDEMQDYLSTVMGAKGNEVSLEMYGVKLFKEKFYFPLKSAQQFMAKAKEQQKGEVKIKNSGFSKETVQKASNPIVLTPFMNVWADHVNEMSMYHAFVLPMEDFYRVYNYKTPTSDTMATESVEMFIQNAYGKGATKYIDQLLKDLNGGARTDSTTGFINKMIGLFKKGAVFASLSVVVQQPSAIARAAALVDTKYFIGPKVDHKRHKTLWNEVKQYAPVAIIKEMGYFDVNMGKSTQDFILGKEYEGFKEKMSALVTDSNYRDEALSKAPALADEIAWCSIWEAVKRETQAKNPGVDVKSEEFLKTVGERFTEVIVKTQVYDSVLSRSGLMRSKDTGMKMATAFMAEPTTSINMVADALLQGKRGNRKYARTAIGAVIASQILNSILVSFVYAGRDDDEDETYLEKYIGTLSGEVLDSLNPAEYIPFIKDIVSIVKGYDVERSDMAVISDLWNAWENLSKDNVSVYRKVEGFAGSIAQIFGLPVKNIMRDARGIYQTVMSFVNGQQTTTAGIGYAVKGAITGKTVSDSQQLYEAYLSGDKEHLDRVTKRYEDEKAVSSAMSSAIREHYMEGDIDADTAMQYLEDYCGLDADTAYWKVDAWEYASETGSSDDYSKYGDFYTAVESGKNLRAVIKEYTDNGVTTGTLTSQITSHFKPQYIEMTKSERASIKGYLRNAMVYCGMNEVDATERLRHWDFLAEFPDYSDLSESAVTKYYESVKSSGISVSVYYKYCQNKADYSKKDDIMNVINNLPITSAQKDALYLAEGWAKSKLYEAPWH